MELIETIQTSWRAFDAGDVDGALASFADDAVMIEGGNNVRSGTYVGHAAIRSLLETIRLATEGNFRAVNELFVGEGDSAFSLGRASGTRRGVELEMQVVTVFSGGGGKITVVRDLPFDWLAWDRFWAR